MALLQRLLTSPALVFRAGATLLGLGLSAQAIYTAGFGLFDPIYHRSLVVGLCAVLVLMAEPLAVRHAPRSAWAAAALWLVDTALVAGMAASIYWFLSVYDALQSGLYTFRPDDQAMALVGLGVLLELTRRTMGVPLFLFGIVALVYPLFGAHLPWIFRHSSFSVEETVRTMWYSFDGVFGLPASVMVAFIFIFVVFGVLLQGTGASDVLLRIAFSLTGRMRGGPAHAAIISSALFGSISGAVTANVVATGVFTIPMIKRRGFPSAFAGAVETAASSGAQFMPPVMGAAAFIMAELTGVNYLVVAAAALLPALFYYGNLFCAVVLEARRLDIQPVPPAERPPLTWGDLLQAQLFVVPIAVILLVMGLGRSVAMAGFWATVVAVALGLFKADLRGDPARLLRALARAGHSGARIMVALGVIGMIIATMNLTGLGLRFSNMVLSVGGDNLFASLALTMAACLVLGMGMPTVPAYLIIVLVMGPAIGEMGVPVLMIHLFVLYYGVLSSITPPVAVAAYAAAPIAEANPMRTGVVAVRLALIGFIIPFVFVYNPSLVLVSEGFNLPGFAWVTLRLVLAIWLISTAFAGMDREHLGLSARALRLALGVAVLVPQWYVELAAFAVGLAVILYRPALDALARKSARPGIEAEP